GGLVSQAKSVHRARPKVGHHHVRAGDEAQRGLAACLGLQVQGQAALVAVGQHEERAHSVAVGFRACPVALPRAPGGRLGLAHVGAEVRQVLHRGRAEQELREGGDAHALEGLQLLAQSTSCMMWSATHTSSPCWFFTSTFDTMRSRSRSSEAIMYSMLMVSPR